MTARSFSCWSRSLFCCSCCSLMTCSSTAWSIWPSARHKPPTGHVKTSVRPGLRFAHAGQPQQHVGVAVVGVASVHRVRLTGHGRVVTGLGKAVNTHRDGSKLQVLPGGLRPRWRAGRQTDRGKSKRRFIPATSFLITVAGVQQKKRKREEKPHKKVNKSPKPQSGQRKNTCTALSTDVSVLKETETEQSSNQTVRGKSGSSAHPSSF